MSFTYSRGKRDPEDTVFEISDVRRGHADISHCPYNDHIHEGGPKGGIQRFMRGPKRGLKGEISDKSPMREGPKEGPIGAQEGGAQCLNTGVPKMVISGNARRVPGGVPRGGDTQETTKPCRHKNFLF